MSPVRAGLGVAIVLATCAAAFAAGPAVVSQARRSFSVRELRISQGNVVRFSNTDEFLHQIYVNSSTFKFSSKEQPPGEVVDVSFPVKGTFEVRCEIHPKMVLSVTVE